MNTGSKTLHFRQGKQFIFCSFTNVDSQVFFDGFQNFVRPTEPAWSGGTQLQMILAYWISDEHSIKSGNLKKNEKKIKTSLNNSRQV